MQTSKTQLQITAVQRSVAGIKPRNEDSIAIHIPQGEQLLCKGIVVAIADGVSAAEAGREASEIAVKGFISDYYSTPDSWSVKQSAHKVLIALNRWLFGRGQKFLAAEKGYVTTFSSIIFKSRSAYVFHVGDSRVYRLRQGVLKQLTRDHVAHISAGQHYLARALGIDVNLDIDFHILDLQVDDIFLLTTDGLHEHIEPRLLQNMLQPLAKQNSHDFKNSHDFESLTDTLIQTALEQGSADNLSCQLVRIDALGQETGEDVLQTLNRLPFPPPLQPGQKLDGWRVMDCLHDSTRSQLYRVQHETSGQHAVMKTPSRNYLDDVSYIERFILEEWVARRIDSPWVVKVVEPPQPRRFLYYLLEVVEGPTLASLIATGQPLDVAQVVRLADKLVQGLRAFHRRETLHQDLKPDNILLQGDDPVIVDFGSVHVAGVDEIATTFQREQALGTLEYSAPEYRLQRPRTPASDQFSLALTLYELLTGQHPFGENYQKAQKTVDFLALRYVPAYRHNPLVPLWLDGALRKAMQINAEGRYPSLSEFLQDLKRPNPAFLQADQRPLIERNPLRFWQILCALLLVTNLVLAVLLGGALPASG